MPPRRPQPESAEDKAIREVDSEDQGAMDRLALQAGPPPDATKLSEADEDEAWAFMDPAVDFEQVATALMTQGVPQQIAQQFLIVKLRPDDPWLEALTQPTQDAEAANEHAKCAQFPFRLSVLDVYADDPDAWARKAETLDRRYQRKMAAILDAPIALGSGYGQVPGRSGGLEGQGALAAPYPQGAAPSASRGVPRNPPSMGAASRGGAPAAQMMGV